MVPGDPIITLHLPRSVAAVLLVAVRKLSIEQGEVAQQYLVAAVNSAEERLLMAAIEAKVSAGEAPPGT